MSTLVIHKELRRRLDQLARGTGLSPTALGNLWLEAAVTEEERLRARDQRVAKALEEVLVRAILRGGVSANRLHGFGRFKALGHIW